MLVIAIPGDIGDLITLYGSFGIQVTVHKKLDYAESQLRRILIIDLD